MIIKPTSPATATAIIARSNDDSIEVPLVTVTTGDKLVEDDLVEIVGIVVVEVALEVG